MKIKYLRYGSETKKSFSRLLKASTKRLKMGEIGIRLGGGLWAGTIFPQFCQAAILLPPAQYDHEPAIPVIEQTLSWEDVQRVCRAQERFAELKRPLSAGSGMLGCSLVKDGKCYIVYTGAIGVLRHELAHCNGWPKDHPGGWYSVTP